MALSAAGIELGVYKGVLHAYSSFYVVEFLA